jgi:hypothetical protein
MIKNNSSSSIFNFPCYYSIKIFGKDCKELNTAIYDIIEPYAGKLNLNQISTRTSTKGNYISYTVKIMATSRSQIDTINKELQKNPLIAYVL